MNSHADRADREFMYDAVRKVATARGSDREGRMWTVEFRDRRPDDSMVVIVFDPDGNGQEVTVADDDFVFTEDTVSLRPFPGLSLRMQSLYIKKLRGFTRGNIPTPDIPGSSLP